MRGIIFFVLSLLLQYIWIRFQRHIHLTQQQKWYGINIDNEIKSATPSMGGVVFLCIGIIAAIYDFSFDALLFWSLPVLSGLIGFADDWMKFRSHTSEGFRSMSKLKVQLAVCAVWVTAVYLSGKMQFGIIGVPVAFLFSAGMINAVNITDGLDGLAGGCFMISLAVMMMLIPMNDINSRIMIELFFMVSGFMFYNLRPAKTFMGDTGSHFLGGALSALCIMNSNTLAIIPAGFMFILEMLSSAIQIFTIRKLNGMKIFLMAPLHHHFQKLGFDETAVTLHFWLVHAVGAVIISLILISMELNKL